MHMTHSAECLPCVRVRMLFEVLPPSEHSVANITAQGFLFPTGMDQHVGNQVGLLSEASSTNLTLVVLLACNEYN